MLITDKPTNAPNTHSLPIKPIIGGKAAKLSIPVNQAKSINTLRSHNPQLSATEPAGNERNVLTVPTQYGAIKTHKPQASRIVKPFMNTANSSVIFMIPQSIIAYRTQTLYCLV